MKTFKQQLLTGEIEVTIHRECNPAPLHKTFTSVEEMEKFIEYTEVRDYTSIVMSQTNKIDPIKLDSDDLVLRHEIQVRLVMDSTDAFKAEIIYTNAVPLLEKYFPTWPPLEEVKRWSLDYWTRNKSQIIEYGAHDRISFKEEREASGFTFNISK